MAKKKSKPQTKSPKSKEAEVPAAKVSAPAPEITSAKDGSGKYLLLIFIIAFAAHLVLNIHIKTAPTVVIDEGLYTNIARSLAFEGELAFRGQPVNYPYLLYPMLLVPVYLLNNALGGDVFHYIQVLGTLLATSSLIPAYLFAKRFTRSGKKALLSAAAVALMPDMLMGAYAMSESLLWMLSLWLIYFAYRLFTEHKAIYGLLTALFSGLMFAAKPGAVVMGAVLLLAYLIYTIREKKGVLKAVLPILLLVAIAGAVYGIFLMLYRYPDTILGLYEKQTSEWKSKDFLVALEAFFLLSFLFVFASGG